MRPPRAQRGQTLVLTALSMLIIVLMMMLSFNLSRAIHQRIALQHHSDALAFSTAVVEARALNYLAYSNRAIAASHVAMMSLHAHMAAATAGPEVFNAAMYSFFVVAGVEGALCALAICPGPCMVSMAVHCPHIGQALNVARRFRSERNDWRDKVRDLDPDFRDAVGKLDQMMDRLHLSQQAVVGHAQSVLLSGTLGDLKSVNAPQASGISGGVTALNLNQFGCALDGVVIGTCTRQGISRQAKARVMTNVANASRPDWVTNRSPLIHFNPTLLMRLLDIPGSGITTLIGASGTGRLVDAASSGQLGSSNQRREGRVVGARESVSVFTAWYLHPFPPTPGFGMGSSEIFTTQSGNGRHRASGSHDGRAHSGWEGVNTQDGAGCSTRGNCFIRFRATDDEDENFGQPSVYSVTTTGELRLDDQGRGGAWELNDDGALEWDDGDNGVAFLRMTAGSGVAASKALVYYHRLGDWREHPNMFNPFWRAKLHPFGRAEAATVLGAAGQMDGAQMAPIIPIY